MGDKIMAASMDGSHFAPNSITSNKIKTGSIGWNSIHMSIFDLTQESILRVGLLQKRLMMLKSRCINMTMFDSTPDTQSRIVLQKTEDFTVYCENPDGKTWDELEQSLSSSVRSRRLLDVGTTEEAEAGQLHSGVYAAETELKSAWGVFTPSSAKRISLGPLTLAVVCLLVACVREQNELKEFCGSSCFFFFLSLPTTPRGCFAFGKVLGIRVAFSSRALSYCLCTEACCVSYSGRMIETGKIGTLCCENFNEKKKTHGNITRAPGLCAPNCNSELEMSIQMT